MVLSTKSKLNISRLSIKNLQNIQVNSILCISEIVDNSGLSILYYSIFA